MHKLFFYPLCVHCGEAASIKSILCFSCTKALCSSAQVKVGSGALLEHSFPSSSLLACLRTDKNQRALKIFRYLLFKYSCVKNICTKNEITHLVLVPSQKMSFEYSALELLSLDLCRDLQLVFLPRVFKKIVRHSQHLLDAHARLDSELFIGFEQNGAKQIIGKNILLLDDVYTTGTSLLQAESLLIAAGAKYVFSYTLLKKDLVNFKSEQE